MQGGATPFFIASQQGHLEVVHLLFDAGADKDIAMQGGAILLFGASQNGRLEVVHLLSDAGAGGHRNAGWHPLACRISTRAPGGGLFAF